VKFVDEAIITVESGHGGAGKVSFRREKFVPRGGPDGGDGGRGGHVVVRASQHLNSLLNLKYKKIYKAADGNPGEDSLCTGTDGQDLVIEVPIGTSIRFQDGSGEFELKTHGQEEILLRGGRGGKGNAFFKNSVNQAPTYSQPGEDGEQKEIILELKLLADVGIIGFPNAGKSTLISKISAARPKIADYPFTTLTPNLGVVQMPDQSTFVVADIPGLIPGAHEGAGLGIKFLKHIEKTKCFLHLIDVSIMNEHQPMESYKLINAELKSYDDIKDLERPLSQRPQVIALNKVDIVEPEKLLGLKKSFEKLGHKVFVISGLSGFGIKELLYTLKEMIMGEN